MEDVTIYGVMIVGGLITVLLGFIIGKLQDSKFLCKQLRQFTKKNYIVLNIVDKDKRGMISKVVNADSDMIDTGGYTWFAKRNQIYRSMNEGINLENLKENMNFEVEDLTAYIDLNLNSFKVSQRTIKWEEGVPVIYVDRDNVKPLDFFQPDNSGVKPNELSPANRSWVANQIAKDQAQSQMLVLLVVGALLFSGVAAFFAYTVNGNLEKMQKQIDTIAGTTSTIKAVQGQGTYSTGEIK
jgi:Na+-transporting NADH:ubiquinone oxidoreductase subunit NqrC